MPRLAEKNARDGRPIFMFDGVHMASTFAPGDEAARWADVCRPRIAAAETVFVLGLGCGYHAMALAAEHPARKIVVIEKQPEIADWFSRRHAAPQNLRIFRVENPHLNSSYRGFVAELTAPYVYLENPYAVRIDGEYYETVRGVLAARRIDAIRRHGEWRPEQSALIQALERTAPGEKELNIKDVLPVLEEGAEVTASEKIWLALGELIR